MTQNKISLFLNTFALNFEVNLFSQGKNFQVGIIQLENLLPNFI
nr:hypothetical protein pmam_27 [Pithovirus mammoth]